MDTESVHFLLTNSTDLIEISKTRIERKKEQILWKEIYVAYGIKGAAETKNQPNPSK